MRIEDPGSATTRASYESRDDRHLGVFRPIKLQKAADAVIAVLADAIRGGLFEPGDLLPSERNLAAQLQVSRSVLREAVDVLRREGILAVKRHATWEPLPATTFPEPPVAIGEDDVRHSHFEDKRHELDDTAILSILATDKAVWFGISRVNEFVELPRDATLATKVDAEYTVRRKMAFFVDQSFVEIAATPDAAYADFVVAVDGAIKSKFVDWLVLPADQLTGRPQIR